MKQITKATLNKPGNNITNINNNMKYLNGQRESYSLSLSSRKRFMKRKLLYVNNEFKIFLFFLPAKLSQSCICNFVKNESRLCSGINFTTK